jgi:putative transposase
VHRHSGIGYHTPESVHYGLAVGIREQRAAVLEAAYAAHPERFIRAKPRPVALPTAGWINAPTTEVTKISAISDPRCLIGLGGPHHAVIAVVGLQNR